MIYNIPATIKASKCPVCGDRDSTTEVVMLPDYPLTELYVYTLPGSSDVMPGVDQVLCFCSNCSHGYLKHIIDPSFLYSEENYNTITSQSQGSLISVSNFATFICRNSSNASEYAIDIGGNDSDLLKKIGRPSGCIIDPNASSDSETYRCIHQFVEDVDPQSFTHGSIDIVSSHTLEHIPDPHIFFKFITQIRSLSNVYIQVPCLELMSESGRYDLIHHQHLHYYTLESLSRIASLYEFVVNDYEYDVDHYGSVRIHLKYSNPLSMSNNKSLTKLRLEQYAAEIKSGYENFSAIASAQSLQIERFPEIYCYGASLMLPIVFYYYPCLSRLCRGILDQDKSKCNLYYANIPVRIYHDDQDSLEGRSVIVSAVATRSACRRILQKLVDRKPMHMFVPFGEF
jgi:hypothetical protein